jgi:hypothetical protein
VSKPTYEELEKQLAESVAHCERLTSVLIDVESESTSGYYDIPPWLYSDVITAMNAKPEKSLAEIKLKAIEKAIDSCETVAIVMEFRRGVRPSDLRAYANQLIQQAKEGVK